MSNPEEILSFWLDELGPEKWYAGGKALDAEIRLRFEAVWQRAMNGACAMWLTNPSGSLAYIILTDQMSRNMFRDTGKAFSSDPLALSAAKQAIKHGFDLRIDEPARLFFYSPLMHSECLTDQDRCVRLIKTRLSPEIGREYLRHAKAHREVIRRFGRFPTRNQALSRRPCGLETAYVSDGGYRKTLEMFAAE